MAERIYKKHCAECNCAFETRASNVVLCSDCKDKKRHVTCERCGAPFVKASIYNRTRYCEKCRIEARHRKKPKFEPKTKAPNKSIEEVLAFARANNISYGKAVLLLGD